MSRTTKGRLFCRLTAIAAVALASGAWTLHRSFSRRDVDIGGGVGVSMPIDKRAADALDEAHENQAKKPRSIFGKVTKVAGGDTLWVLPNGGTTTKVRLDRIAVPKSDQPHGKEAWAHLRALVAGKDVEVRYTKRGKYGMVLGEVMVKGKGTDEKGKRADGEGEGEKNVNLLMVKAGMAKCGANAEKTSEYAEAEREARLAMRGIWAE